MRLLSSPKGLMFFGFRVSNDLEAGTLVPANSEAGWASERVSEQVVTHETRPPAECGGCTVSTALASAIGGHENGLDLSSYDPQAYNILSPVLPHGYPL